MSIFYLTTFPPYPVWHYGFFVNSGQGNRNALLGRHEVANAAHRSGNALIVQSY
jgi:hypothetical protein